MNLLLIDRENRQKNTQKLEITYIFLHCLTFSSIFDIFWQGQFCADGSKAAISELLIENGSMRLIYSRLVPAQVSNEVFWRRYFFRASGLEEEHGRRMRLLERVGEGEGALALGEEAEWGEDEDAEQNEGDTTIGNSAEGECSMF